MSKLKIDKDDLLQIIEDKSNCDNIDCCERCKVSKYHDFKHSCGEIYNKAIRDLEFIIKCCKENEDEE